MNRFEIAKGDDYFLISAEESQVQLVKNQFVNFDFLDFNLWIMSFKLPGKSRLFGKSSN